MHALVTHGHFRSRDNDGGHTIRSAVTKNSMLHANVMAYRTGIIADKGFTLREWEFLTIFAPMTFIYEIDPYSLEIHQMRRQGFRMLSSGRHTYRQTDRQTRPKLLSRRFAGGQNNFTQFMNFMILL